MALSINRSVLREEYEEMVYEPQLHHNSIAAGGFNKETTFAAPKAFTVTTQTQRNVGKVRWLQANNTPQLIPDPYATEYIISTSTGEAKSDISLWRLRVVQEDYGQLTSKVDNLDTIESSATVTDLVSITEDLFALTTSKGSLSIYKCPRNDDYSFNRIEHVSTKDLHQLLASFPCPARALTTNGSTIITVGEDGSIFEMNTANEMLRSLKKADPLSICCVANVGRSEILTGNNGGQLKLWDLRRQENSPVQTMNPNVIMNTVYGTVNMAVHPSQNHLVIVAYQSGCMDLYDIRLGSGCDPIANLASDGGSLSELYFHQTNPDHFFSCSQSGQVSHWYPGQGGFDMQDKLHYTPDVNIEFLKRGLVFKQLYMSPFPVNSLNLSKHDRLVSGGDNGVIFCTEVCANN